MIAYTAYYRSNSPISLLDRTDGRDMQALQSHLGDFTAQALAQCSKYTSSNNSMIHRR